MRTPRILIAAAVSMLLLSGCGDAGSSAEQTPSPDPSPSVASEEPAAEPSEDETEESPAPEGTVVEITINGDNVEPNGARVEADLGEPITLQITSDRAGELHVHSTPEQQIAFPVGTTTAELTIEQPGVIEVEDHHSGLVVVQLEVS